MNSLESITRELARAKKTCREIQDRLGSIANERIALTDLLRTNEKQVEVMEAALAAAQKVPPRKGVAT